MHRPNHNRRLAFGSVATAALVSVFILLAGVTPAAARQASEPSIFFEAASVKTWQSTVVISPTHPTEDLACRLCHGDSKQTAIFPSGEELSVQVDLGALAASAHGVAAEFPLLCSDCHQSVNDYQFPHAPIEAGNLQEYHVNQAATCIQCHQRPHLTSHPGLESEMPVVCTDCHGAHDVLTVAEWEAGEGTETCVACHTQQGAGPTDPPLLTALIRDDLFSERADNDYCLSCHSQEGLALTLPNGDTLELTISEEGFHDSVHGLDNPWQMLQCSDRHENYIYPHPPVTATTAREYSLEKYPICADCHEAKYEQALDSVHATALAEGNLNAAVCTDCHGAHYTPPPDEPRERISYTCGQCHGTVFEEYVDSVHGEALLSESNPDVPTCIECHGVHNINDPTTALFRIQSPQLCATCHADVEMMNRYDISTAVFETYVADFHGTTVTLFEHQDPTVETNKAVCYDCHGVHDIMRPDDPQAGIKVKLLETCQQCHPDATTNFPDAWTSHFVPSLEHNPLVYLVNLFYQLVIPATVGFFGFLVVTDVYRRTRQRFRPHQEPDAELPVAETDGEQLLDSKISAGDELADSQIGGDEAAENHDSSEGDGKPEDDGVAGVDHE